MSYKCIICEKEIPVWDTSYPSTICGGTVQISFGFGSRYDWIGLRKPKYHPTDPILKEKYGYHETHMFGKTFFAPSNISDIQSVPIEDIPESKKDLRVASKKKIITYICDDCFEKKIDFIKGIEE